MHTPRLPPPPHCIGNPEDGAWRQLHQLLLSHDGVNTNFSLSAAAVHAALQRAPGSPLPAWLLDYFGAAPPHLARDAAAPIELSLRLVNNTSERYIYIYLSMYTSYIYMYL